MGSIKKKNDELVEAMRGFTGIVKVNGENLARLSSELDSKATKETVSRLGYDLSEKVKLEYIGRKEFDAQVRLFDPTLKLIQKTFGEFCTEHNLNQEVINGLDAKLCLKASSHMIKELDASIRKEFITEKKVK